VLANSHDWNTHLLNLIGMHLVCLSVCLPLCVQGLVGVAQAPGAAALTELNCETDFVARNTAFSGLLPLIAAQVASMPRKSGVWQVDPEDIEKGSLADGRQVGATTSGAASLQGDQPACVAAARSRPITTTVERFGALLFYLSALIPSKQ
jgi:hypothetical protein